MAPGTLGEELRAADTPARDTPAQGVRGEAPPPPVALGVQCGSAGRPLAAGAADPAECSGLGFLRWCPVVPQRAPFGESGAMARLGERVGMLLPAFAALGPAAFSQCCLTFPTRGKLGQLCKMSDICIFVNMEPEHCSI